MSKLNKLKSHLRRWGWLRTVYLMVMRFASHFLGLHVFVVRTKLPNIEVNNPCELADLEFRRLHAKKLTKWSDDLELDLDADFLRAADERSDIAFGVYDKSLLISYVWGSVSAAPHTDDLWGRVERPHWYSYKSFTRPAYRGNHIVPALIIFSEQEMLKLGYSHRAGYIAVTNFKSLEIGKYMGSYVIGYIGYLKWFGRYFFFRSKRVAEIGFEFFEPAGS